MLPKKNPVWKAENQRVAVVGGFSERHKGNLFSDCNCITNGGYLGVGIYISGLAWATIIWLADRFL